MLPTILASAKKDGWREVTLFLRSLFLGCALLAYGFGTVKLAHATSKLKRDERGRKKGTPNKGLIKCRGDDTRCKACRNKMAPCHRRERPADCDCAYCASSPMLEAKEPNSPPPRTPTLLTSTPSRSTVHAQKKHTFDEAVPHSFSHFFPHSLPYYLPHSLSC